MGHPTTAARPGAATAAALLAFLQGGVYLGGVVWQSVDVAASDTGLEDLGPAVVAVLGVSALGAALVLGGLSLLRHSRRAPLASASCVDALACGVLLLVVGLTASGGPLSTADLLALGLGLALLIGPVLRLVLLGRPRLLAWAGTRRSPGGAGAVLAVVLAIGVLAAVSTVLLVLAAQQAPVGAAAVPPG
ncbi:hypothetical protein GCM10027451_43370 [Geodermatophilus aquaeductus]|uniref:Uncharacterized protein n=1 Tax=Geodermatophilus aquaeductus TaxID=1564161 RepID=A0A521FQR4_9ACTN|nr:hypothetical protein [Geodermatophilus aquaeductus]SMO98533.1 hypothetical protein SAMN06273567_113106 [Geodermatophilus aquaeductus]